jgi:hypothetical protein
MAQINLAVEIYIGLFSTARKATKNNMDLFVTVLSLAVQKSSFPEILNALISNF